LHSAATHYAPGLQKPWTAPSLWPQTPQKIRSVDDPHPDLAARQSVAPHAGQTPPSPDGLLANSCAWPASTRRADASARDTSAPRSSANLIAGKAKAPASHGMKATQLPSPTSARCHASSAPRTSADRAPSGSTPPTADQSGPRICAGSTPSSLVPATRSGAASHHNEIHKQPSASRRTPARLSSCDVITRIAVPASTSRSCHPTANGRGAASGERSPRMESTSVQRCGRPRLPRTAASLEPGRFSLAVQPGARRRAARRARRSGLRVRGRSRGGTCSRSRRSPRPFPSRPLGRGRRRHARRRP
jgi:hypothetical protein